MILSNVWLILQTNCWIPISGMDAWSSKLWSSSKQLNCQYWYRCQKVLEMKLKKVVNMKTLIIIIIIFNNLWNQLLNEEMSRSLSFKKLPELFATIWAVNKNQIFFIIFNYNSSFQFFWEIIKKMHSIMQCWFCVNLVATWFKRVATLCSADWPFIMLNASLLLVKCLPVRLNSNSWT